MAFSMPLLISELESVLGRSWVEGNLRRTMGRIKKVCNGQASLDDELEDELFYLRLRGGNREQERLSDILRRYYQYVLGAWPAASEVHSVPVPAADLEMEILDVYLDFSDSDDVMEEEEEEFEPSLNPSIHGVLGQLNIRSCDGDGEEEATICSVCLEDLYKGSVATLGCHHEFHAECIGRWLVQGQNFCPLCKARALR